MAVGASAKRMTVVLSAGSDRVSFEPDEGGKISSLVAGGAERIVTRPEKASPDDTLLWGCFFMAPWVGRLADGEMPWGGETHRFPRNFGGHAIHGLGFDSRWSVDSASDTTVVLSLELERNRWPFGGSMRQTATLAPGRLELAAEISAGDESMPVSLGWHPYFRRPDDGDLAVEVKSATVLETTSDLIPTGQLVEVDSDTDLRGRPILGDRRLDHVYASVAAPAVVAWPDLELTLDFDAPIETVVVYTPPHAACVEPQTAWPNAPALASAGVEGTGLQPLSPGETLRAGTTWSWTTR